jgi:hypothetical protein
MVAIQGGHPPFKGDSPHLRPQPARTECSPTRSKLLPLRHGGWAPHVMQAGPGQKKPNRPRAERTTAQRLQAFLHYRPDQRVKGRTAMQAACNRTRGRTLSTLTRPAWRSRPTCHVTGAPVTTCEKLHSHSRQYRAFSTAEPVPRLEVTLRMTQQCQPSTSVTGSVSRGRKRDGRYGQKGANSNGGGRRAKAAVKSSASSCPLMGQQDNPLPRREDNAPVFRSSNDSRTHNGCPANHSSRRINTAAG